MENEGSSLVEKERNTDYHTLLELVQTVNRRLLRGALLERRPERAFEDEVPGSSRASLTRLVLIPSTTGKTMVRPKGFEPLTYGSGGRRSIQLS